MNILDSIQLLLIIPIVAVSLFHPQKITTLVAAIINTPVVIFSIYLLLQHKTPSFIYLPQAIMTSFLLFVISIWITEEKNLLVSLKAYLHNIEVFFRIGFKKIQEWNSIVYVSFMTIYEELVWRIFLVESLSLYLHAVPVILSASFLFFYSHANQRNLSRQSLDLFLFGFILTTIYYFSRSFILVALIHWIRNMIIITNSIGAYKLKTENE